jgi:hypothetical protein
MSDATVTVSRNFPSLADLELTDEGMMREIGLEMRERIVRRTRSGQGPDGAFAPLSEGYAKRKRAELGTASPDLTVSGNMLNDITIVAVDKDSVTLGWNQ